MAETNPVSNQPKQLTPHQAQTPPRPQHSKPGDGGRTRTIALVLMVLLIALFAIGVIPKLKRNRALAEESKQEKSAVTEVAVTKPHPSPGSDIVLPGTTQAIADALVGARATGYVRKRYVDIGSHVKAGQLLAEIESPDADQSVAQAQAQTAQAQATVRQAQADVANKQSVVAQTRSQVKQAEANVETARAQLSTSKSRLAQLQSALATAQAQYSQAQQNVGIKQGALKQAMTQRDLAGVTLNRYQTLLKSGYVALQDVDQSQANFDNATAAVNSAQSDVNAVEAAVRAARNVVGSAQANVRAGQSDVRAAEKNVQAVAATVGTAQAAVGAAKAGVQQSQANVAANQSAVVANQANSRRASILSGFSQITAPFDGVITARNVEVGSLVSAGSGGASGSTPTSSTTGGSAANVGSAASTSATPNTSSAQGLFGIARTDTLRILVSVPQTYARQMRAGVGASISFREFPNRPFLAVVHNVSGALDAVSRTLLTEIYLPNPTNQLLPGMYAQIKFDLPSAAGALRVPAGVVIFDAQGTRIITVTPDNKLHFVGVKVGRDYGTEVEILDGLTGQETLVATPSDALTEGETVKTVQAPPPPPSAPGSGKEGQPGGQGKPGTVGAPAPGGNGGATGGANGAPGGGASDSNPNQPAPNQGTPPSGASPSTTRPGGINGDPGGNNTPQGGPTGGQSGGSRSGAAGQSSSSANGQRDPGLEDTARPATPTSSDGNTPSQSRRQRHTQYKFRVVFGDDGPERREQPERFRAQWRKRREWRVLNGFWRQRKRPIPAARPPGHADP